MKVIAALFLNLFISVACKSQLISYYNSIKSSEDTIGNLRYFAGIDRSVKAKIDSFLSMPETRFFKKNKNQGIVKISIFESIQSGLFCDIAITSEYASYRILTSNKLRFGSIFAFAFYKSKLLLFTVPYTKYKINSNYETLIRDLVYDEMPNEVKKEIDANVSDFEISLRPIVKRYYLKY